MFPLFPSSASMGTLVNPTVSIIRLKIFYSIFYTEKKMENKKYPKTVNKLNNDFILMHERTTAAYY